MRIFFKIFSLLGVLIGFVMAILGFTSDENIYVKEYVYKSSKIDSNLRGLKILQLSDFHNHSLYYKNGYIVDKVLDENPDIIFLTGDLIDQYTKANNIANLETLFESIKNIPTYYVTGNHEYYASCKDEFLSLLKKYSNINVVTDSYKAVDINGTSLNIVGLRDPYEDLKGLSFADVNDEINALEPTLKSIKSSLDDNMTILLSHRPSMMDLYARYNMDLVFSGHTHGGQVNIFPFFEYQSGRYEKNNTSMIISNGIGSNGKLPIRVNCPMQIVTCTFETN